jgi:NhaP-type Na+/H+ or K+/H+ antiporter
MQRILTKREKIILYITIGVIIFSIIFNFLILPVLTKIGLLNKEINLTQTRLKKYTQLLSQKDYIQSKYNKFISRVGVSGRRQDTLVDALSELENLAKEANIRIIDIRPQTPGNINLYKEIIIDLRTEGTMEGYLKFIYNIENSLLLLRIKRFQLNAKPATEALEGSFSISQISVE